MRSIRNRVDRRRFLAWTAASSAFFAAHGLAQPIPKSPTENHSAPMHDCRILQLELQTAAPLPAMRDFYHRQLGLRLLEDRHDRLAIAAGQTTLTFVPTPAVPTEPFYHFAFNIPENKILAAYHWQRERTSLLPIPSRLRDPQFPDEVVNYAHWNAHSVFFFDPAGNVVEYIARHDLENATTGDFGPDDVLYTSEIAFVTDDVPDLAQRLGEIAGVTQYRGGDDQFIALGDAHGLLLVMKRGRVISFDAPVKKSVSPFAVSATIRGSRAGQFEFGQLPYKIQVS